MPRTLAGTLLLPNNTPLSNAKIHLTAKRVEPSSILTGINTSFTTDSSGVYSRVVVDGWYQVAIEYLDPTSGSNVGRRNVGDIFVDSTPGSVTLNALLIATTPPEDPNLGIFYELLAQATAQAAAAESSAAAAAASAASITIGTGPTNIPNTTILNARLGTSGNLGNGALATVTTGPNDTTPGRLWRNNDLVKVTTASDQTPGRVPVVDWMGIGGAGVNGGFNLDACCFFRGGPDDLSSFPSGLNINYGPDYNLQIYGNAGVGNNLNFRKEILGVWSGPYTFWHTGNVGNDAVNSFLNSANKSQMGNYIEELGTFTPLVYGTTSSGTCTYPLVVGRYRKLGNIVHCQISLGFTGHTGSGSIRVAGLPFTPNGSSANFAIVPIYREGGLPITSGNSLQSFINPGVPEIVLVEVTPTGSALFPSFPVNLSLLSATFSYEV